MMKLAGYGIAAAIAMGAFSFSAQAAPAAGDLKATAGTGSGVEKAAYRRCWWHNGHRHCRWVGDGYGYRPGVNLYIGRDRHHHHHRRHHRH